MSKINKIDIIKELKHEDDIHGVYSVVLNGKQVIFIKNGNSIGAVQHYYNEPASKCVSEIREDVKRDFLSKLMEMRTGE